MKSPGLSAAPAVAEEAVAILKERGVLGAEKADYKDGRRHIRFKELSAEEKAALVKEQPAYGQAWAAVRAASAARACWNLSAVNWA